MSNFIIYFNKNHEQTGYESTRTTSMKKVAEALSRENANVAYAVLQINGKRDYANVRVREEERKNIVLWIRGQKPHFRK